MYVGYGELGKKWDPSVSQQNSGDQRYSLSAAARISLAIY